MTFKSKKDVFSGKWLWFFSLLRQTSSYFLSDARFSYLALVQDKKIMCVLPANACCTVYAKSVRQGNLRHPRVSEISLSCTFAGVKILYISLKDNQGYRLHNTSTLSDIYLFLGTSPPYFLIALFLLETVTARSNLFEQQ